jgi:bifunctional non-homologous end joining protein LigD
VIFSAIGVAEPAERAYFCFMLAHRIRTDGFTDPCISTLAAKPPSALGWVHEIEHDGYRLIARRDGTVVRLFTRRRGYDWTVRYPAIVVAAAKLRARSFTLDGEAVVAGADGVAVFDALHRRHKASGASVRFRPFGARRGGLAPQAIQQSQGELAKLLMRAPAGIPGAQRPRPGPEHHLQVRRGQQVIQSASNEDGDGQG